MKNVYLCIRRYNSAMPLTSYIHDYYKGQKKLPIVKDVEIIYDTKAERLKDIDILKSKGLYCSVVDLPVKSLFSDEIILMLLIDVKDCKEVFPDYFHQGLSDVISFFDYEFPGCNPKISIQGVEKI